MKIYPIVKCSGAAREKLIEQLVALGYSIDDQEDRETEYLCLMHSQRGPIIGYATAEEIALYPLNQTVYWGSHMTLVNSPIHMLAYIKKMRAAQ